MRVTVTIPDPIGQEAEKAAQDDGSSVSALYAAAVEEYLKQRRRQLAVERIGRLIGSIADADQALDEIERERRRSDRDVA